MAWLRWVIFAVSIATIALLPFGDALAQGDSDCPRGSIIPHPYDCQKYFECLQEKLLLLTCDDGTYFDGATSACTRVMPPSCYQRKDTMGELGASYRGRAVFEPCLNQRPGVKLAHPEDCSMFFQCTQQGGTSLFHCPANLLFHTEMKVCVWPQQVVCEPGAVIPPPTPPPPPPPGPIVPPPGPDNEDDRPAEVCELGCFTDYRCPLNCDPILPPKVFPHPSRCDAYFRCSSEGYACETVCPPGMWFHIILQRCAYMDLVGQDCVPVNRPSCDDPICLPNPNCPEIDTIPPTVLPYPGNENQYYVCRDGSACQMTCPPGLVFNPPEGQCDFPPGDTDEPEITTLEPETTTTTLEPETTTTTLEPETTTTTLEPETTTTTLEPETTTTTLEPETTTTTLEPETTTTTLEPETTTTTLEPETTTTTLEPETTTTTTEEPSTPAPAPTTTTEGPDCPTCPPSNCVPDSRCPLCEKCFPTYFPHEDCDKFYKCNFGLICEMNCPPGLHFNAHENVCDWPGQAGCDGPTIDDPPGNSVCQPDSRCPPYDSAGEVFLPHPDCGLYYKCSWGNACLKECPNGLHWSMAANRCEWPFLAGCDPNEPPINPDCPTCPCIPCRSNRNACQPSLRCPPSWMTNVTMSFGHEQRCSKFYECLSGQACVLDCPVGLEYSGGAGRCDVPSNSMCSRGWE